jgi:menaquinone-specific isochorismate synthase
MTNVHAEASPDAATIELAKASKLRAITRALPASAAKSLDLLAFAGDTGLLFTRETVGLAARGEALRISLPGGTRSVDHVRAVLDSIMSDDPLHRAGTGAVAFGALAFAPDEAGELIVPREVVAKSSDGTAWWTRIDPIADDPTPVASMPDPTLPDSALPDPTMPDSALPDPTMPELVAPRLPAWSPHGFDLHSSVSHPVWCEIIATAVEQIRNEAEDADGLRKVVLARSVDVEATDPFVVGDILARLHALFPSCMVFSIEGFIGASPELLVSRKGSSLRAHPLAGTVARSGDPDTDAKLAAGLLSSAKDRWEHLLVIDALDEVLRPLCDELDVPQTPSIVPLRNVSHLGTLITGSLRAADVVDRSAPTALELVSVLNPTPAVGGVPQAKALAVIAALEPVSRGTYAGPVGWVDAAGNGEWAVGLRSARIEGNRARMFAGGGIVGDSEPGAELAETQLKLQALLAAVVRP